MAHYIDKDALVAEIGKRIEHNTEWKDTCKTIAVLAANQAIEEDKKILSIINSIRVKEVDLEKELKRYCNDYYNCDYPKQLEEENCSKVMLHIVSAARHFFELGLKAQKGE